MPHLDKRKRDGRRGPGFEAGAAKLHQRLEGDREGRTFAHGLQIKCRVSFYMLDSSRVLVGTTNSKGAGSKTHLKSRLRTI